MLPRNLPRKTRRFVVNIRLNNDERLLYEEIVYVYFTRITFMCTLRENDLWVLYDETVYVAFTKKLLTPLYDESFPRKVTTN